MSIYHRQSVPRIAVALLLSCTASLGAQADTSRVPTSVSADRSTLCWRPRPEGRCRSYLVTQLALERALLSSGDDPRTRLVGTVGPMINRSPTEAWGLLVSLSTDDPDHLSPLRIEGRYRRWLSESTGLDLGLGFTHSSVYRVDNFAETQVDLRGLTAAVGIEQGLLGVETRLDLMHGGGQTDAATFVGVRLGGYAGPLAAVVGFVGFYALFALAYRGS